MLPLPRMGWAERGVWHSKLLMLLGVRCVCTRLTMPPPSVPRSVTKYRASRDTRSLVRRKRSASAGPAVDSDAERGLVPQIASPVSGASRKRLRIILGVNCFWTRLKMCPDSAPGARAR